MFLKVKYDNIALQQIINTPDIEDRVMTILYGSEFVQVNAINFVSLSDGKEGKEVTKEWADFIMKCSTNQRLQNLSFYEQIMKLHSIILYGKSSLEDKIPVQALLDCFSGVSNGSKLDQSVQQQIARKLNTIGSFRLNGYFKAKDLPEEKFFDLFYTLLPKTDIEQIIGSL